MNSLLYLVGAILTDIVKVAFYTLMFGVNVQMAHVNLLPQLICCVYLDHSSFDITDASSSHLKDTHWGAYKHIFKITNMNEITVTL